MSTTTPSEDVESALYDFGVIAGRLLTVGLLLLMSLAWLSVIIVPGATSLALAFITTTLAVGALAIAHLIHN